MKKNLFLFGALILSVLNGFSQSNLNLVVFSEDGDQFFAYINGIRQNEKPESNVKVTNLTSPNINLRIEFSDKSLPQLKQNMSLEMGFEHTAKITRDVKKQVKLRYFGQAPITQAASPGVATVQYHSAENSSAEETPRTSGNTITTTTTTTQTYNTAGDGNAAVNINVGGAGITMNVSGMDPNAGNIRTTTSTTVTSSSSGSGSNQSSSNTDARNQQNKNHVQATHSEPAKASCVTAMTAANFNKMKESVDSKPFSDTKMSTAKIATKNTCLSVDQIKEICKLFSMDDEKLTYAKFAYIYCVDKANFYQVSEIFSFSGTTEELNSFLENN